MRENQLKQKNINKLQRELIKNHGKFIPVSSLLDIFCIQTHTYRYYILSHNIPTLKVGARVYVQTSKIANLIYNNSKNKIEVN